MAIQNPYGVGDSGHMVTDLVRNCACCRLRFGFRGHPNQSERWPTRCQNCADHDLSGPPEDQVAILTEHNARAIEYAQQAHDVARRAVADRDEVDRRNRGLSYQLRLEREDERRRENALWALRQMHPLGSPCACGQVPCEEQRIVHGLGA